MFFSNIYNLCEFKIYLLKSTSTLNIVEIFSILAQCARENM